MIMSTRNSIVAGWVVIVMILCQLVPLNRVNPHSEPSANLPADVRAVLMKHCFQCHSNSTQWPISAYIAPFSWIVVREVHEARNALNFSTVQNKGLAGRTTSRNGIYKLATAGNLSRHARIPGFPKIMMSKHEQKLLLDWSARNKCEPEQATNNSGPVSGSSR
jgi:hypothetical protein